MALELQTPRMEPDHLTESEHLGYQPPPAPRAIGRAAFRASWGDLRVRLWWITALAVGIVALVVAGQEVTFLLAERSLILHGTEVTAKLLSLDNITRPGYRLLRTDSHDVRLQTTLPDGRQIDLEGRMSAGLGSLQVGTD